MNWMMVLSNTGQCEMMTEKQGGDDNLCTYGIASRSIDPYFLLAFLLFAGAGVFRGGVTGRLAPTVP